MQANTQNTDVPIEFLNEVLLQEHDGLATLVQLLKEEQTLILQRKADALQATVARIEAQLQRVQSAQKERDDLLDHGGVPSLSEQTNKLSARIAFLPQDESQYSVMVAQRIDGLMALVHELAWQNHVLLSHSVNFLQELLAPWTDSQGRTLTTYGQSGHLNRNGMRQGMFHAVA